MDDHSAKKKRARSGRKPRSSLGFSLCFIMPVTASDFFLDFLFGIRASSGSVPDPQSARPPKPPKPLSVVRVVSLCRGIQGNTDVFGSDFAQKVRTLCPVHWAETHSFISQGIREDQLTRKEVGFPQRITMLWTGAGKDCRNVCETSVLEIQYTSPHTPPDEGQAIGSGKASGQRFWRPEARPL